MNDHRTSDSLAQELRNIAEVRPMSAMTRIQLRKLANKVEMVEHDRDALLKIVKGPITGLTELVLCPTK